MEKRFIATLIQRKSAASITAIGDRCQGVLHESSDHLIGVVVILVREDTNLDQVLDRFLQRVILQLDREETCTVSSKQNL